tara:strand:- start:945 stop:1148 length:204 start_codon:yes stop_codon:yes gene_type:complete
MILRIEKEWGQQPRWFSTLDKSTQISLITEYRIAREKPKKTRTESNRATMLKAINKYQKQDRINHGN